MDTTQQLVTKTLEMMESPAPAPTTEKSSDENKRRRWLNTWLKLKPHHPELLNLEGAVYRFCADYAKQPRRGRRLVIHGNNGAGKSHSAKAIFKWASRLAINLPLVSDENGVRLASAMMLHWPGTVDRMKEGQWWMIDDAVASDLLILDDVGAEHDPSRCGAEKLYLILERRETRWTVITTNAKPEHWERKFERRISSRLIRNSEIVSVENVPDYNSI